MVVVEHWFEELKASVRWRAGLLREQPSNEMSRVALAPARP
jgi:hypothetical protein